MSRSESNPWLHRFAVLTVLVTLGLIGLGGLVTSKGAGMAVPDWPTSYGYNMFALPFKFWQGGAFYEHTHRLAASGVGMLTTILAVWLWRKEARGWLRWLGVIAFFAVGLQGVLGGLRVVWFKDALGIFHAALAQLFLALVGAIALFTSRWWTERGVPAPRVMELQDRNQRAELELRAPVRRWFLTTTILIFLQLVLGATMRHQHAGLAIPDFPLAYGKLWPAADADSIQTYNARRVETTAQNPITAFQIELQMAHRWLAVLILAGVAVCAWQARTGGAPLRRLAFAWLALVLIQAGLGAWTIWSNKAADVATGHVLVGAFSLVTGVVGCIICFRRFARVTEAQGAPRSKAPCTDSPPVAINS
jgi:cytochrome c oxidase assembly protein subunit 15